jgi:hypothetical protein
MSNITITQAICNKGFSTLKERLRLLRPLLHIAWERYQQGEEKTATLKMTGKMV